VTQSLVPADPNRLTFFEKLLVKTDDQKYDVTKEFLSTLNVVVRTLGLTYLDFESVPFNSITFWLPSKEIKLKGVNQDLSVYIRDESGVINVFKYRFNDRNQFERHSSFDRVLAIQSPRYIDKETFRAAVTQDFPLLSQVFAQNLFYKEQLSGFKYQHLEEDNGYYKVSLQTPDKMMVFQFTFTDRCHRDYDYSIGGRLNYE
jgi:hypothetical protein